MNIGTNTVKSHVENKKNRLLLTRDIMFSERSFEKKAR